METNKQPSGKFVVIYTAMGPLRAEVIKSKLESSGIPAFLKYESASTMYALVVDGMGQVEVLVPQDREQEARELIGEEKSD